MASLVNHFSFPPTVFVFLLCQFVFVNAFPACPVVSNFASLEDCIRSYWFIGYKYASIVTFLSLYHSIHITVRQLKYLINIKYNLRRRNNESAAHKVLQAVRYELWTRLFNGLSFHDKMPQNQRGLKRFLQHSYETS